MILAAKPDSFESNFNCTNKVTRIGLIVFGFLIWWPFGLAILAYLLWSGKMRCHSSEHSEHQSHHSFRPFFHRMHKGCCSQRQQQPSSGNTAFDDYRQETLQRLEEDQRQFVEFLERLRRARDQAEFDQFMAEREQQRAEPAAS
jgi:hypothetical protein